MRCDCPGYTTSSVGRPSRRSAWYSCSTFCTGTFQSLSPPISSVGVTMRSTALKGESRSHSSRFFQGSPDRKSTRLNSSHLVISYAVFCLKKKNKKNSYLREEN